MPGAALNIAIEIPDVQLGVLGAEQARVGPAGEELAREMDAGCERLRRELSVEQVAELESIRGVRAMFRAWGVDPSRYRPSAEALLRRVVQGKGLYRICNVVDISNLGSIESGWPYGTYNRAAMEPPVALRLGQAGEKYEGIGQRQPRCARAGPGAACPPARAVCRGEGLRDSNPHALTSASECMAERTLRICLSDATRKPMGGSPGGALSFWFPFFRGGVIVEAAPDPAHSRAPARRQLRRGG